MQGELEAYFATLGALGGRILATDRVGASLTSAEAITRFVAECERVKRDQARVFFIGQPHGDRLDEERRLCRVGVQ